MPSLVLKHANRKNFIEREKIYFGDFYLISSFLTIRISCFQEEEKKVKLKNSFVSQELLSYRLELPFYKFS